MLQRFCPIKNHLFDKTEPIDSGSGYNPWPPPSTVWLEGIAPTEECPSRVVMWVAVASPGGATHCVYCGYEGQHMTVDGPVLTWEKGTADSADLVEIHLKDLNDIFHQKSFLLQRN